MYIALYLKLDTFVQQNYFRSPYKYLLSTYCRYALVNSKKYVILN